MRHLRMTALALAALALVGCGKSGGPASGGSGKITVSNIEKDGRNYTVTFNGAITIRNIQIKSGRGGQFLAFPQRKGDGDRFFNYVKVNREDGEFLLAQVKNEEISESPSGFEITNVSVKLLTGPGKKKAFVEFELNGVLKLYSWGIIVADKGPFLVPPSERDGDDWKDVVFATREFRDELQAAALEEFEKQGGSVTAPAPPAPTAAEGEGTGDAEAAPAPAVTGGADASGE